MLCFYYPFEPISWYDFGFAEANGLIIPAGMGMVLRDTSGVAGSGVWEVDRPY